VLERVTVPEQYTPVVLTRGDFAVIQSRLPPDVGVVRDHDENVILLPGPFAPCVAPIVGAGGKRAAPVSR
jgi:hypothetical protein